jgi:hypothetical protein
VGTFPYGFPGGLMADESDNSMTRRDFLLKGPAAALGGVFALDQLAKDLYSGGIEDYGKEEQESYNGRKVSVLKFKQQGTKMVRPLERDFDYIIPEMLSKRLIKNGIDVVDNGLLLKELKDKNVLEEYGISFEEFMEYPAIAAGKIDGMDIIGGSYTITKISSKYIDLSEGKVLRVFEQKGNIDFRLEETIDALAQQITKFMNGLK